MADVLREIFGLINKRYRDMGDGSHAEVVAAEIEPATGAEFDVSSRADRDLGKVGVDGDYTTPTHTAATVTTASGAALAANANRKYALLINDSDTIIYVKLGAAAVANQGIRLNANGGSYEMSDLHGNLYTGAINAIHGGTGNKVLLVTEGV